MIIAWFYLAEGTPTSLIDIECANLSGSPGIRILLSNLLEPRVENKWGNKITYRAISGVNAKIPRNQWVKISFYLFLSESNDGVAQVKINNNLIIDGRGPTIYSADGLYNRMQVGVTANSNPSDAVIYVDDLNFNTTKN